MFRHCRSKRGPKARLSCEVLEPRRLLATFTVANLNDSGPGSLRDALGMANGSFGVPDTIEFDPTLAGGTIGLNSYLGIFDDVTITGPGSEQLTIDAQGNSRAFFVSDLDGGNTSDVHIQGLTITGGSTTTEGGGIYNEENLTLTDVHVRDNFAGQRGGGIVHRFNTELNIADSVITGNEALEEGGGGLYLSSGVTSITNSQISFNTAGSFVSPALGGGIAVSRAFPQYVPELSLVDSTVSLNYGSRGGGIASSSSNLDITNSIIAGNNAYTGGGIGSANDFITISDSTISGNTAVFGGGIISSDGSVLSISYSSILDNSAYEGGGVNSADSFVDIINSTIAMNSAVTKGGGVSSLRDRNMSIRHTTISSNEANAGGGLLNGYSSIEMQYSTITQNTAVSGYGSGVFSYLNGLTMVTSSVIAGNANSDIDIGFFGIAPSSVGFNVIGTGTAAPFFNESGDISGVLDPGLAPLADNGGPTLTHALVSGSVAIDNGAISETYDQRGAPYLRVVGAAADSGAYELQATINGDFDDDGDYSCLDIDALVIEIVADTHSPMFDLTVDGLVDEMDLDAWLAEAGAAELPSGGAYLRGDANLDGNVDGQDFLVWNSNKFNSIPSFCSGDFNADGEVDGGDFILWNANKFTSADVGVNQRSQSSRMANPGRWQPAAMDAPTEAAIVRDGGSTAAVTPMVRATVPLVQQRVDARKSAGHVHADMPRRPDLWFTDNALKGLL